MKPLLSFLFAVFFPIVMIGVVLPMGIGCATKPTTAALNASKLTHVGVAAAMRAWNAHIRQQVAEIAVSETLTNAAELKATKERKAKLVAQARQVRDAYEAYQMAQIAAVEIAAQLASLPTDSTGAPVAQDHLDRARGGVTAALAKVGKLLAASGVEVK